MFMSPISGSQKYYFLRSRRKLAAGIWLVYYRGTENFPFLFNKLKLFSLPLAVASASLPYVFTTFAHLIWLGLDNLTPTYVYSSLLFTIVYNAESVNWAAHVQISAQSEEDGRQSSKKVLFQKRHRGLFTKKKMGTFSSGKSKVHVQAF